jgi:hypothetical protein
MDEGTDLVAGAAKGFINVTGNISTGAGEKDFYAAFSGWEGKTDKITPSPLSSPLT